MSGVPRWCSVCAASLALSPPPDRHGASLDDVIYRAGWDVGHCASCRASLDKYLLIIKSLAFDLDAAMRKPSSSSAVEFRKWRMQRMDGNKSRGPSMYTNKKFPARKVSESDDDDGDSDEEFGVLTFPPTQMSALMVAHSPQLGPTQAVTPVELAGNTPPALAPIASSDAGVTIRPVSLAPRAAPTPAKRGGRRLRGGAGVAKKGSHTRVLAQGATPRRSPVNVGRPPHYTAASPAGSPPPHVPASSTARLPAKSPITEGVSPQIVGKITPSAVTASTGKAKKKGRKRRGIAKRDSVKGEAPTGPLVPGIAAHVSLAPPPPAAAALASIVSPVRAAGLTMSKQAPSPAPPKPPTGPLAKLKSMWRWAFSHKAPLPSPEADTVSLSSSISIADRATAGAASLPTDRDSNPGEGMSLSRPKDSGTPHFPSPEPVFTSPVPLTPGPTKLAKASTQAFLSACPSPPISGVQFVQFVPPPRVPNHTSKGKESNPTPPAHRPKQLGVKSSTATKPSRKLAGRYAKAVGTVVRADTNAVSVA